VIGKAAIHHPFRTLTINGSKPKYSETDISIYNKSVDMQAVKRRRATEEHQEKMELRAINRKEMQI
jgi:hypothetical protein